MNIMQMMKQAQSLQQKLKTTQEELANVEVTGEAAGGAVVVTCDGQGKFKSIKISKEAMPTSLDTDSIEMFEDVISAAIKQASDKASKQMEEKLKAATGGINIPGLF